jgi:EAL domain-containing protein (putative c-di-GMP-specific phosphodiesterase class I)
MRLSKDWPWLAGGAFLAVVTLGIGAYALGSGSTTVTLLSVALIALAMAQLTGLVRGHLQQAEADQVREAHLEFGGRLLHVAQESSRVAAESTQLVRGLSDLRQDTQALAGTLSENLAALRAGNAKVADSLQTVVAGQRDIQDNITQQRSRLASHIDEAIAREQAWLSQMTIEQAFEAAPEEQVAEQLETFAEAEFESSEIAESLQLALEPIVDLYTSNTAHYRLVAGMTNSAGQDVPHDVFIQHAERTGLRDQLDLYIVQQTLELLEQLRARDPALCVFVPIGASTLGNPQAINDIVFALRQSADLGQGVALDLPHAVLASLPEACLEGLASLARANVIISLSNATIAGIELSSLNRLNVRFVSVAAGAVGIGVQVAAGLAGFVQSARALRIQVVISNLNDARNVPGLARIVRYACGPAFALPRKLKRNLPDVDQHSAAA